MQHFTRYVLLAAVVLSMALLALSVARHRVRCVAGRLALDNWDIPDVAEHLNRTGLKMRLCSTRKDGGFNHAAYLTITDKDWDALNLLPKVPRQIQAWRGTV